MTKTATTHPLQIAVLDRGFVYVGRVETQASGIVIHEARCIRRWGTDAGLGQLARTGPRGATKMDSAGTVRAPTSALIHLIDCTEAAWAGTDATAAA